MNQDRGSTSEGIWNGWWVLIVVLIVGAATLGYMRLRQARRAEAQQQAAEQAAVERAAELSATIDAQQRRIEQLETRSEALRKQSSALRKQLERTGE
jgi:uncharacterized protein HemX